MRALLDVNVLIALLDRSHVRHDVARGWLEANLEHGWATCAVTQNGCLRIMSQPGYAHPLSVQLVADLLQDATNTEAHEFWPDATSLLTPGVVHWQHVSGPKQLTDLYLLALATKRGGRFVTFDERVARSAVPQANDRNYHLIPKG